MGKETNAFTMIRRIGGTSYRMKVVFSPDATETMSEKILCMIQTESMEIPEICGTMETPPQESREPERSAV